jgi:hypothetical protein
MVRDSVLRCVLPLAVAGAWILVAEELAVLEEQTIQIRYQKPMIDADDGNKKTTPQAI